MKGLKEVIAKNPELVAAAAKAAAELFAKPAPPGNAQRTPQRQPPPQAGAHGNIPTPIPYDANYNNNNNNKYNNNINPYANNMAPTPVTTSPAVSSIPLAPAARQQPAYAAQYNAAANANYNNNMNNNNMNNNMNNIPNANYGKSNPNSNREINPNMYNNNLNNNLNNNYNNNLNQMNPNTHGSNSLTDTLIPSPLPISPLPTSVPPDVPVGSYTVPRSQPDNQTAQPSGPGTSEYAHLYDTPDPIPPPLPHQSNSANNTPPAAAGNIQYGNLMPGRGGAVGTPNPRELYGKNKAVQSPVTTPVSGPNNQSAKGATLTPPTGTPTGLMPPTPDVASPAYSLWRSGISSGQDQKGCPYMSQFK